MNSTLYSNGLRLVVASVALVSGAAVSTAGAQEGSHLEEVIVTAQRRSEDVQNVPIAIAVIQPSSLRAAGITDAVGLDQLVPGLKQVHKAAAQGGTPFIRGIGFASSTPGIEQPVATYIDDVYVGDAVAASPALNSIDRIEVLKGPQGTLFGRNAVAGVINIHTKDPSSEPSLSGDIDFGNYETVGARLYGTTGLGDIGAANLSALYREQHDGIGHNSTLNEDYRTYRDVALRAKVSFDVGENSELMLTGWYGESEGDATSYRLYPGRVGMGGFVFTGGFYDGVSSPQPSSNDVAGASIRGEHDLGWARIVDIAAYYSAKPAFTVDADETPDSFQYIELDWDTTVFTNELQLISPDDSWMKWLVGFYYLDQDLDETVRVTGALVPGGQVIDANLKTQSWAPFGEVTLPVLPKTRLTLGARYNADRRELDSQITNLAGTPIVAAAPSKDFAKPTYRVAVDYQFSDDVLGYVSYNRGYKPGTYNPGTNPTRPAIGSETIDAYEIGMKTELFSSQLRVNTAAFYYDYKNLTLRGRLPNGIAVDFFNGKGAEVYGLDLDLSAVPSDRLTLTGGVTVLHSEYTDFSNAQSYNPLPLPTGGNAAIVPFDATGNRLSNAPEVSGNVGLEYRLIADQRGNLSVSSNYSYYSRFFFEPDNRLTQSAYGLLNASVSWMSAGDRWGVTLWGTNLADERFLGEAAGQGTGDIISPGMPRMYGVRLSANFGN